MSRTRSLFAVALLAAPLLLSACADMPKSAEERAEYAATNDPLEPVNRTIFDVNDFLDRLLIRPLAELYRVTVPPPLRDRIAGIVSNMKEPVIFANNLLQGEVSRAGTTLGRFAANTTIGVGGMWDVADHWGMHQQMGDFGQTLYTWGLGSGPYLVLPFFGPSNIRDAVGLGVDSVMSPWGHVVRIYGDNAAENGFTVASLTAQGLTKREQNIEALDALREGSLDFYAQMRSVTRQYRDKQLGVPTSKQMPKFDD